MSKPITTQPEGKKQVKKAEQDAILSSYGQDEEGAMPREEREEILNDKIEGAVEVRDPVEEQKDRELRDEMESAGSQDPYTK